MKFEEALFCEILRYVISDRITINGKKISVSENDVNWKGIYYDGFQVDKN